MPVPAFPDLSKVDPKEPKSIIDALARTQRELLYVLQSLDSTNIHSIDPTKISSSSSTEETGYCGVGAIGHSTSTELAGVGVNFRFPKAYTPSSVTLTATASNVPANVSNITQNGFWLYINGNGTSSYLYWRGTYKA